MEGQRQKINNSTKRIWNNKRRKEIIQKILMYTDKKGTNNKSKVKNEQN